MTASESSPPVDKRGKGPSAAVAAALEVLREAGWSIRDDSGYGQLADTDPPLLMMTYHDPDSRKYARKVAQQPWTLDE